MKKNMHPPTYPVVFVDIATGDEIITTSTLKTEKTKVIDGVEHYIVECDVTSFSHPFFTGEQRFVDRQGRVDKFLKKVKLAETNKTTQKKPTAKVVSDQPVKSYQQILKEEQQKLRQKKADA